MTTQPKNVIISGVTLNYARLDTPAENPFGGAPTWEAQLESSDRSVFAEVEGMGMKVKESGNGTFTVSVRRKSETNDGRPMDPVRVVDANKAPLDGNVRRKIGNGSKGNVIVWAAPYEYMKKTGITFSLTAVQVTDLVEYTGGNGDIDFDVIGGAPEGTPDADMF